MPNSPYALLTEAKAGVVPGGGGPPITNDFSSLRLNWNRLNRLEYNFTNFKRTYHVSYSDFDVLSIQLRRRYNDINGSLRRIYVDSLRIQRLGRRMDISAVRDDFPASCSALPAVGLDFTDITNTAKKLPSTVRLKLAPKATNLRNVFKRYDAGVCGGTGMRPPKKQLYSYTFSAGLHLQYAPVPGYHESTRVVDIGEGTACGHDPLTAKWSIPVTDPSGPGTEIVTFSQTNPHLTYLEKWPTGDRIEVLLRLVAGASPHVTLEAKHSAGVTAVVINPSTEPVKRASVQSCP